MKKYKFWRYSTNRGSTDDDQETRWIWPVKVLCVCVRACIRSTRKIRKSTTTNLGIINSKIKWRETKKPVLKNCIHKHERYINMTLWMCRPCRAFSARSRGKSKWRRCSRTTRGATATITKKSTRAMCVCYTTIIEWTSDIAVQT